MEQATDKVSLGLCAHCGAEVSHDEAFCYRCKTPTEEGIVNETKINEAEVPWYFSSATIVLTFLLLTPVWSILVILDKRKSKLIKIAGVAVFFLYLFYFGSLAAGYLNIGDPVKIKFGADYVESSSGINIFEEKNTFYNGDQLAWLVELSGPVKSTSVNLLLSKVTASGGEQVIDTSPLTLANPDFNILYGKFPLLLFTGEGTYKFRVVRGDKTLAEGSFGFQPQ